MTSATSYDLVQKFIETQHIKFLKIQTKETQKTQFKIYRRLTRNNTPDTETPTLNCGAILNKSGKPIPPEVQTLISLGPKFALLISDNIKAPMFHMIAEIEAILNTKSDKTIQDKNRCVIVNKIQNYLYSTRMTGFKNPAISFYKNAIKTTKKFISDNKDILILQSDKGKRMVVMEREDYNNKMLHLLNDPTYEILNKDPTNKIAKQTNNIINRLLMLKLIDKKTATFLESKNPIRPCIYGQPKAHKPDLPLRPVVPNITAPTYKLAKYVSQILQSSFKSQYNIKDSFQLVKVLQQIKLPPDYILVSFDVVSLFTNTPKRLITHDIIMNWDTIGKATNISLDLFIEIIELCLESCYFCFGNKFYRQKEGTAMGSPSSPILCDLTNWITFYTHSIHTIQNYNSQLEVSKNNCIPFLDTVVSMNEDRTLNTEWYSKEISSGRLLNYFSFHPLNVKLNVARNFIKRVIMFDTRNQTSKQHTTIHKMLRLNNYPKHLINRLINRESTIVQKTKQLNQHPPPTTPTSFIQPQIAVTSVESPAISIQPTANNNHHHSTTAEQHTSPITTSSQHNDECLQLQHFPLTYIPNLSNSIAKLIKNDYANIRIANSIPKPLGIFLPRVKDPIAPSETPNIVYSIPCHSCSKQYIGMSRNSLKTRLVGHKSNVKKYEQLSDRGITRTDAEMQSMRDNCTALIAHIIDESHTIDLDNAKIIDRSRRSSSLPILEMCHIYTNTNTLNFRTDVNNLSSTYSNILQSLTNTQNTKSKIKTNVSDINKTNNTNTQNKIRHQ
ncbi:uncharacterized protein LOC129741481 [Uranotaenia lowii]|uniref:uncharacterized protein LOC129741481 n=1 Tax=Uranotaenia lowii TaxID=190385 RepID=UPI00247AD698|nr:uncharacterized protein LOC129741481 [Uranotaenia lowii]